MPKRKDEPGFSRRSFLKTVGAGGVAAGVLGQAPGAGAQNVMGTAVFWGMLVATFLGVFLIPGNFAFVEGLGRKKKPVPTAVPATPSPEGAH